MAKRRADLTLSKKLDILKITERYKNAVSVPLPNNVRCARGCLQNLLTDEAVLPNEASLFGRYERKRLFGIVGERLNLFQHQRSQNWSPKKSFRFLMTFQKKY